MVEQVGSAQVILTLAPDPPVAGVVHAQLHVAGVAPDVLRRTTVRFRTDMTSMGMSGPSGFLQSIGAAGDYRFDVMLGMAASWSIGVQFTGALHGTATYRFAVMDKPGANVSNMAANSNGSMAGMSGMTSPPSGNPDAWRNALFALVILMIIAVFVVRRDRRPLTLTVVVGAGLFVLILAILQNRYTAPTADMASMSTMQGGGATPVVLATIRNSESSSDIFAPGTVQPYITQDIVTRAPGILQDFHVYVGDHVRTGELLATLDSPELGSTAAAAQAAATVAEIEAMHHAPNDVRTANNDIAAKRREAQSWSQEITRERTLLREGAVSLQEYQNELAQNASAQAALRNTEIKAVDAGASVNQAQARYSQAQSEADAQATIASYRSITAPDDAVVLRRLVDPGVYVAAGTPILRIAVVNRLRIQANVAQENLSAISIGTPLEARLADGSTLFGRVSSIAPVADLTTHTAQVEAIVAGGSSNIPPGGYVRVTLHVMGVRAVGGLEIPSVALIGGGADTAVWIDNNGIAHRVGVRVISDNGTTAFIKGALQRGVRVVTDGAATLEEGQAITEQHG